MHSNVLLNLAGDRFHPEEDYVYLSFSLKLADNPGAMTKIVRGKIRDNAWPGEKTLLKCLIPHDTSGKPWRTWLSGLSVNSSIPGPAR